MEDKYLYTLREAGEYAKVHRQAIFKAIKKGRLKAHRDGKIWVISKKDLDQYRQEKKDTFLLKHNGEYIFDVEKGYFSVHQVAQIISHTFGYLYRPTRIYYLIRSGQLRAFRKGRSWVITRQDAINLLNLEHIKEAQKA